MSFLRHIGVKRRSGRYPWGSGGDAYQRTGDLLSEIDHLREKGLSETEIAKGLGLSTTDYRTLKTRKIAEAREAKVAQARTLREKGLSNVAIGEHMGLNESSVRSLLDETHRESAKLLDSTADILRENVSSRKLLDVGAGVEAHLGVSRTKMDAAVAKLQDEGYQVYYVKVPQVGTGKTTVMKVLAPPGTSYADVYRDRANIALVNHFSEDGGRTFRQAVDIVSVDSKRVFVRYGEDGGKDKDGVIELRRGVEDLSLGNARYAQVRIMVDGKRYMKGMAMHVDDADIPEGYDIIYNSNKDRSHADDVFKKISDEPGNPFKSAVRTKFYVGKDGKQHPSPLNIVNEEGDWKEWSRTLSSQMLSKQRVSLVKKQLGLALDIRRAELDEILSLSNPTLKKHLLADSGGLADDLDAAAVHLKAAALPRQASHVILPFPKMRPTEIYAPNYKDGETVALIRHPHGGIFEIPILTVNNKNRTAMGLIGRALDAVGIHPDVAQKLSGADFDGDTVLVIPTNHGEIKSSPSLKGLKDFDPKTAYPYYEGMRVMSPHNKQIEMGKITNLITDMTIRGATEDELARAVKHSMVVIDSEKHKLDYTRSEAEQGIPALKKRYQGGETAGSTTLISQAKSLKYVDKRDDRYRIDPTTGEKVYRYKPETRTTASGRVISKKTKSTKMAEETDARRLSSGSKVEEVYADYANSLKAMANEARLAAVHTEDIHYSPAAKLKYAAEVSRLNDALAIALRNKPLERQAQLIANAEIRQRMQANPDWDSDDIKKAKSRALTDARIRTGQKKASIVIGDREWEAIQAGAVSPNILKQILTNTDLDALKQRALPKTSKVVSAGKLSRAKSMLAQGYTQADVAAALGISVSNLIRALE